MNEPKLCKDCSHAVWPHPLQNISFGGVSYGVPMCGHPDAGRSVVSGALTTTCQDARGEVWACSSNATHICGPTAKLFEQMPPPKPPQPVRTESLAGTYGGYIEGPLPPRRIIERFVAWIRRGLAW